MIDTNKVLVIASGHSALQYADHDYVANGWCVVAVNNAWQVPSNYHYWCRPKDFAGPKPNTEHITVVTEADYEPCMLNYGGTEACCGAGSITLSTLYWALDTLKPKVIGLLGCDMDYTPDSQGHTAFYGVGYDIQKKTRSRGKPDPLFQAQRSENRKGTPVEEYLISLYNRFQQHAHDCGVTVINFSKNTQGLLPYPHSDPAQWHTGSTT